MTALVSPSKSTGSTTIFLGFAEPRLECTPYSRPAPWSAGCAACRARTARRALADLNALRLIVADRVARQERQRRRTVGGVAEHLIDGALPRVDQRRELEGKSLPTVTRSRWPWSMRVNFARLVFSQSCSWLRSVVRAGCRSSY